MKDLQYPIGDFIDKGQYSAEEIVQNLEALKNFPANLEAVLADITAEQLATAYRPDSWTAQQVVHHIADSHMNMLTRLKWTLTEDAPVIKAYFEDRWALQNDYSLPIAVSINMLKGIHAKVIALLEDKSSEILDKTYVHPENGKTFSIKSVMALYAWHGAHHIAHIKICKGK